MCAQHCWTFTFLALPWRWHGASHRCAAVASMAEELAAEAGIPCGAGAQLGGSGSAPVVPVSRLMHACDANAHHSALRHVPFPTPSTGRSLIYASIDSFPRGPDQHYRTLQSPAVQSSAGKATLSQAGLTPASLPTPCSILTTGRLQGHTAPTLVHLCNERRL